MEATSPLDSDFSSDLRITGEMKGFLKETAKWAKFLSIVGFVFIGFMVLIALFMGTFMSTMMSTLPQDPDMPIPMGAFSGLFSGFYLVMAVIYFFPFYYQLQFANKAKRAIRDNDQIGMSESLSFLKSTYKFWGILMAVLVGFYVVMFLFTLLLGGFAAFM